MHSNIKEAWVEDLRSGKFPQASGVLVGEIEGAVSGPEVVGYCCLGVLTHQFVRTHPDGPLKWSDDGLQLLRRCDEEDGVEFSDEDGDWYEFSDNDLPIEVAEWAGITGDRGEGETVTVTRDDEEYTRAERDMQANPLIGGVTAIYRNDDKHETFEQIADAIEQDETL